MNLSLLFLDDTKVMLIVSHAITFVMDLSIYCILLMFYSSLNIF